MPPLLLQMFQILFPVSFIATFFAVRQSSPLPTSFLTKTSLFSVAVLLLISVVTPAVEANDHLSISHKRTCEPILTSICKDVGYNFTSWPNLVGIDNQKDATEQLETFQPLIQIQCSTQLRFFLCSVYMPMCTDKVDFLIGPCRPLCESVRDRCHPTLKRFGFPWPQKLECSQFPQANNPRSMCMKGPGESETGEPRKFPGAGVFPPEQQLPADFYPFPVLHPPASNLPAISGCKAFKHSENLVFINTTGAATCALQCEKDQLFKAPQKQAATVWMGCFAGLTAIFAIAGLLSVVQYPYKLDYPEKAVVFISLCYGLSTIGYMIRLFVNHSSVACTDYKDVSVLVVPGLQNLKCTIVFLFIYYFSIASVFWWFILCCSWYLVTGLRKDADQIEKWSWWFHFPAWFLPALLTVIILVHQTVESDELTGLCNVGITDTQEMFRFLLIPQLVFLLTGLTVVTAGFITTLCCSNPRNAYARGAPVNCGGFPGGGKIKAAADLELDDALFMKLGMLAAFYVVPQGAVIAAYFYEYAYRELWLAADSQVEPSFSTFVVKICSSLVFGIVSSGWVLFRTLPQFRRFARAKNASSTTGGSSIREPVESSIVLRKALNSQQQQRQWLL